MLCFWNTPYGFVLMQLPWFCTLACLCKRLISDLRCSPLGAAQLAQKSSFDWRASWRVFCLTSPRMGADLFWFGISGAVFTVRSEFLSVSFAEWSLFLRPSSSGPFLWSHKRRTSWGSHCSLWGVAHLIIKTSIILDLLSLTQFSVSLNINLLWVT